MKEGLKLNTRPMKISVIIMAYNRKKFLLSAVNSALEQTLDRKFYEVIVIKNFHDSEIDEELEKKSVGNLVIERPTLAPEMFQLAIAETKNEIVAFLEDDDQFEREKLETAFNAFNNDDRLVFYHSGSKIVNETGDAISNLPFYMGRIPHKPLILDPPSYSDEVIYYDAAFNISAMCVLKSAIDQKQLQTLLTNQDMFMLFSAMASGGRLLIDNKVLTRTGVHDSNVSANLDKEKKKSFVSKYAKTYYQMREMISGKKELEKLLDVFMGWAILRTHGWDDVDKRLLATDLKILWAYRIPYLLKWYPRKAPLTVLTTIAILVKLLNGRLGRHIFLRFRV